MVIYHNRNMILVLELKLLNFKMQVHLVGGFEDVSPNVWSLIFSFFVDFNRVIVTCSEKEWLSWIFWPVIQHASGQSISQGKRVDGYSIPLCKKIVETMQKRPEKFHVKTLCVLRQNTKYDSQGNALPIFNGLLVSSSFHNSSI